MMYNWDYDTATPEETKAELKARLECTNRGLIRDLEWMERDDLTEENVRTIKTRLAAYQRFYDEYITL